MDSTEVAGFVIAWAREVLPDLASDYDFIPAGKSADLPDIVADIAREGVVREDPRFPLIAVQQAALRVWKIGFSIMVESGEDDDGARTATEQLRGFANALTLSLLNDPSLGGRVPFAAPDISFDYTAPFVEYSDGTRGREMAGEFAVAEPVVVQD